MEFQREQLRIYFRRRQIVDETGNVVIQCNPDNTAEYVPGTVDTTWIEMTGYTDGLDKLSLDWDKVNSGTSGETTETNQGGSNYDKGISLSLTFNDVAFEFIRDWLDLTPCGTLNSVEVMITDYLCLDENDVPRNYRTFEIKADNLTYSPFGAPCEYEVKLREADPVWHCIHKTFIWDNWQNWFMDGGAKQHPCFLTGIESRPRLLSAVRLGLSIFGHTVPVFSAIFNENNDYARRIQNVDNFIDAPLIRDIISNVTDKCGLTLDTIFHDPASPYYNLCLYYPGAGAMHQNDGANVLSPALSFHFENRWNITLAELLDKLKPVFNAEWYVTPNSQLVFKPKAEFLNTTPIFDFSLEANQRLWDKYSLRYTFNGNKKPAYGRYGYAIDASDLASQELQPLYNDIIDYDGPKNNKMLEGNLSKNFEFASTGAVKDGRSKREYLRHTVNDAETAAYAILIILAVVLSTLGVGIVTALAAGAMAAFLIAWTVSIAALANDLRDEFDDVKYTGIVRLTSEQVATPRLLIWDGVAMNRAKMTAINPNTIAANTYYNPTSEPYTTRNKFQYTPAGVFNYEMYFDGFFTQNLFDRYHDEIDNPVKSLARNQTFELNAFLCCEMLDLLGVWENDFAKIGYFVKLEQRETQDIFGRIEHFTVNYDDGTVNIKGQVYRVIREPVSISEPGGSIDVSFPDEDESVSGSASGSASGSDPGSEPACCDPIIVNAEAETIIPDGSLPGGDSESEVCCTPVIINACIETILDDSGSGSDSGSDSSSESGGESGSGSEEALRLIFSTDQSAQTLTDWNTFFDTATNADTAFTSVVYSAGGTIVDLFGCTNLDIAVTGFVDNLEIIQLLDFSGEVISIGGTNFDGASNFTTIDVPACTLFGANSFRDCVSLTSVTAPLVVNANAGCFSGCTALITISLPSCTGIDNSCFAFCSSIQNIDLPVCVNIINGFNFRQIGDGVNPITINTPVAAPYGGTTGDDLVFFFTSGQTITITLPTAETGDPDITSVSGSNSVTLIPV